MFSEPGPSRYAPPHQDQKYPIRDIPPRGGGPPRRDSGYDRDDRPNGFGRENGPRPYPTSTWRPPGRYGNAPSRARTPSPQRGDYDRSWNRPRDGPDPRDVRDRPNMGPRPGGPPDWRGREPWNDRRYDSRSNPQSRSPTRTSSWSDRQHSPPSGPKGRGPPPSHNTPYPTGPRIPSGPSGPYTPRDERDRSFDRVGFPGRDGDRSRETPTGPRVSAPDRPPIAPRSMRGSSSPVENKHHRPIESQPLSTPTTTIPLPAETVNEAEEGELEEGEVLSPVRVPIQPAPERPMDSFRPRSSFSPSKRGIWNERRSSPVKRERSESPKPWRAGESVDDGWASRRRTSAQNSPEKEAPSITATAPPAASRTTRPPTPPISARIRTANSPEDVKDESPLVGDAGNAPSSEDAQALPGNEPAEQSQSLLVTEQPSDAVSSPTLEETTLIRTDTPMKRDEMESMDTIMEAAQETANAVNVVLPDLDVAMEPSAAAKPAQDSSATSQADAPASEPPSEPPLQEEVRNDYATALTHQVSAAPDLPSTVADIPDVPASASIAPSAEMKPVDVAPPVTASLSVESATSTRTMRLPSPLARQTLAERRAVVLPPTNGPLSSPFVAKTYNDPAPTLASVQERTDTEYPPPGDRDDRSDVSMTEREDRKANRLIASIKSAQLAKSKFDPSGVLAWNASTSPKESSRVAAEMGNKLRNKQLRDTTWPLHKMSGDTAKRLARRMAKQMEDDSGRVERLKEEYLELEEEWRDHCKLLDDQMAKRGPPPADLYAFPAILPIVTPGPGPVPTTPVAEDLLSARAIRRRGAGDAVTTEAEFQEILAAMADSAAKDPNFRASKTTAVVPDMLTPLERTMKFDDENDVVQDPLSFYDYSGTKEPVWTDEERAIFLRRYLNFPKQFGKIAEAIPDKTASDCVLYYYRTKKEVDYKAMLASRRGVTKKKALPIKKGGKSSALLSDLARQKPTVEKPSIKAASMRLNGDANARKAKETGIKRRTALDAADATGEDPSGSRAGSDVSGLGKAKMRVSMKTKRPRVSSLPDTPGPSIASPTTAQSSSQAQNELLPPLKRPRKHRKVDIVDANGVVVDGTAGGPGGTPGEKAPRRGNTSSYWSVEEKKRVRELFVVHGRNIPAIAGEMPGKTERQIGNFIDAHVASTAAGAEGGQEAYPKPNGMASLAYDRMYPPPHTMAPHAYPSEPRLGVFPTTPTLPGESKGTPAESPIKHVSRPGGMRISALLNDDAGEEPPERKDGTNDAASDGTVDEQEGATRSSPRTAPISMNTIYDPARRYSGATSDRPPLPPHRPPENRGYYDYWSSNPPRTYPQGPPPPVHQHPRHVPPAAPRGSWDRHDPPPPTVHHNVGQPSMGYFRTDYRERLGPPPQQSNERHHSPVHHPAPLPPARPEADSRSPAAGYPSAGSLPLIRSTPSPQPPPPSAPSAATPVDASSASSENPEKTSNQPWNL